jgi:ADP-ribosylglycohydrolase
MTRPNSTAIVGCLLGTAVGDALGLPYEGLSPQRQRRIYRVQISRSIVMNISIFYPNYSPQQQQNF